MGGRAGRVVGFVAATAVAFVIGVTVGRIDSPDRTAADPPVAAPVAFDDSVVAVYGDSLVSQAGPYLEAIDQTLGVVAQVHSFPGAAPCDAVATLRTDAPVDVDVVVWAFSGNRASTCMLDTAGEPLDLGTSLDAYRRDTEEAIAITRAAGARFVLAIPPAQRDDNEFAPQVDLLYRALAMEDLEVQYVDAGSTIAPGGRYASTESCLPFEAHIPSAQGACQGPTDTIPVRGEDGTHFCTDAGCDEYSSGAMRYAINLLAAARLQLDLQLDLGGG